MPWPLSPAVRHRNAGDNYAIAATLKRLTDQLACP